MKAIIVARVSTEEQKEAGNSLPGQTRRVEQYFDRKKYKIIKRFSFDESGYKEKRSNFEEVLEYIKNIKEPVAVGFDKVDRLSRDVFDKRVAELYYKALSDEIELHFPSDGQVINSKISAVEKFQFGISLGLAKYYSDAISDNVKRAQEQKLRRGEYPTAAAFGYANTTLEDEKKWIAPHKFNSLAVKSIFNWYASDNFSIREISKKLKSELRINKTTSMVHKILNDKFYIGTMVWNGVEYPHQYECFISKELFNKAQSIMNGRSRSSKRFKYAGKPAAYRGLFRCHQCGCSMTPDPKKRKLADGTYNKHFYYHCTNYHKTHDKVISVKESEINEQLANLFKKLELPKEKLELITQSLKSSHENKNQFYKTKDKHYTKEIKRYQKRRELAYSDRIDDRITWEHYEEIRKESDSNIATLEEEIGKLNHAEKEYYLTTARLVELGSRTSEIFLRSKPIEKRQLINFVLSNGTMDDRKLRYTVRFPFNLVLKHAPSSSWLPGLDSNQ